MFLIVYYNRHYYISYKATEFILERSNKIICRELMAVKNTELKIGPRTYSRDEVHGV